MTAEHFTPIAIVGMAGLFPKAPNLNQYWSLLKHGEDAITEIPPTHWKPEDYFNADPKSPDHTYAQRGGFLQPFAFDPLAYGLSPKSLESTDTSQIFAMIAAQRALEDAGYAEEGALDKDRVSVILGVTGALELVIPLGARLGHPRWKKALQHAGIDPHTAQHVIEHIQTSYPAWTE
ncbi:MAG: beta-ketoacyl synthase N-terminal-like domain-containing protein, partial [Myxococcota bacterium]